MLVEWKAAGGVEGEPREVSRALLSAQTTFISNNDLVFSLRKERTLSDML